MRNQGNDTGGGISLEVFLRKFPGLCGIGGAVLLGLYWKMEPRMNANEREFSGVGKEADFTMKVN
jgi:hypothetical protein